MALGKPTPDQKFSETFGVVAPLTAPQQTYEVRSVQGYPNPNTDASMSAQGIPNYYVPLNIEIAKSYVIHPTNQGQRGGIAARQVMMNDPRNSPSRSQFNEGYTIPIQQYGAQITWETPSAQNTAGKLPTQPSMKLASPFTSAAPIPTRMPWDL